MAPVGAVWQSWGHVLIACALAAPVAAVLVVTLARRRVRRGVPARIALRHTVAEIGVLAGTLPWVWMILTPAGGQGAVSLVPLVDLAATLRDEPGTALVQVGANSLLFLPLGFLLPLRFPRLAGVARMTAVGAAASAVLELCQYVFDLGRVSSVDDVLMNATGAAIGAGIGAVHAARLRRGRSVSDRALARLGLPRPVSET